MRPVAGATHAVPRARTGPADGSAPARKPAEAARLRQAAQEFEAIFIEHMMRTARQSGGHSGLFPSGPAGDLYRDMADQEMARSVAKGGGLGLGNLLLKSLERPQLTKSSSPRALRPIPSNESRSVGGDHP
jgi:flagellar protein FlgJ